MNKIKGFILATLLFCLIGAGPTPPPLVVREIDGSPKVTGVTEMQVTNDALTNVGGGKVRVALGTGSLPLAGGSLTGYLNTAYATVASHATTSAIWAAAGNIINFTGGETITALPAAAQAGSQRWLICAGTPTFTHNGTTITVQGGVNYTAAAGDVILVTATTTTAFKITVFKQSGLPTVLPTAIPLTSLAPQAAYTILANATAGAASPTAVAPVANGIWGCNGSSVCAYYTNFASDDSAYQFYSATASKGTRKLVQSSIDNGILLTDTAVVTGNATHTNRTHGAGTFYFVFEDDTQTLTNKTLTAPYITAPEVLYATAWLVSEEAYTFTAAEVSRTIINTYGRGAACDPALPTAAAGMTFIVIVGTQHNSKMEILKGASDLYWETAGVPTKVASFHETNQVVGSRASCATFKTGAAAWSWVCGAVSGTWATTGL